MSQPTSRLLCIIWLMLLIHHVPLHASEKSAVTHTTPQRIISLAPHLTELVYAVGAGDKLVAVSDYSDYPEQASQLPSVASFQGVDFEAVLRLKPDLILAWQGGNKPQDLSRLESLGFQLFYSNPKELMDISHDIRALGAILSVNKESELVAAKFDHDLEAIKAQYQDNVKTPVFYYLWPKPLMTIGKSAWGNELLEVCSARNIFDDAINDYPEVPIESVIRRKPQTLIAVNKESRQQLEGFWQSWLPLLELEQADIKQVNPDLLHRFTPRLLEGLSQLCKQIN